MAERPKGYGMTAELADKKAAKEDPQLQAQARQWIEAVTGESIGDNFYEGLQNGVILCKLINTLQPGSVKKVNTSTMAFKKMENIGNYLSGCERYGCNKQDIFQTVDLYEQQNKPQVINGIIALGRKAQANGFDGPTIGPKESVAEKKDWTEEQLKAGQNIIGLQMGTNKGASRAGMDYGTTRQIMPNQ